MRQPGLLLTLLLGLIMITSCSDNGFRVRSDMDYGEVYLDTMARSIFSIRTDNTPPPEEYPALGYTFNRADARLVKYDVDDNILRNIFYMIDTVGTTVIPLSEYERTMPEGQPEFYEQRTDSYTARLALDSEGNILQACRIPSDESREKGTVTVYHLNYDKAEADIKFDNGKPSVYEFYGFGDSVRTETAWKDGRIVSSQTYLFMNGYKEVRHYDKYERLISEKQYYLYQDDDKPFHINTVKYRGTAGSYTKTTRIKAMFPEKTRLKEVKRYDGNRVVASKGVALWVITFPLDYNYNEHDHIVSVYNRKMDYNIMEMEYGYDPEGHIIRIRAGMPTYDRVSTMDYFYRYEEFDGIYDDNNKIN